MSSNKIFIVYLKKYSEYISIILALITLCINFLDIIDKINLEESPKLLLIDNTIVVYFIIEYLARLSLSKNKKAFIKNNKLDLIACIPFNSFFKLFRVLKLFKLLKLLKLLKIAIFVKKINKSYDKLLYNNGFIYLIYLCIVIIFLGAIGIYLLEKDITVKTFSDSIWWAFVTATTVGYGDVSPATDLGRIIAAILMIFGIGTIGAFTGNITSYFFQKSSNDAKNDKDITNDNFSSIFDSLSESEKQEVIDFTNYLKTKRDKQ